MLRREWGGGGRGGGVASETLWTVMVLIEGYILVAMPQATLGVTFCCLCRSSMLSYVKCKTGDEPPSNAVKAGFDDGPSYHARGVVNDLTIPGKARVRSENDHRLVGACIPYGSAEHRVDNFEVLTVDDPSALTYERCVRTYFVECITQLVRVLENLENPHIFWHFPGLESPGKMLLVLESSRNLLKSI